MSQINKEKIRGFIGQLVDLEAGNIDELVIKRGTDSKILMGCLLREIEEWRRLEEFDAEMTRQEKEAQEKEEVMSPKDAPEGYLD